MSFFRQVVRAQVGLARRLGIMKPPLPQGSGLDYALGEAGADVTVVVVDLAVLVVVVGYSLGRAGRSA